MKKHIPNCITLLNQMSGIIATIMAYNGDYFLTLIFVLLGAGFDFCDGAVARLLKVQSPMGKELDSLADMISFGLVPGMLAFKLLQPLHSICFALPFLGFVITLFSALRLAKFNIDERQHSSFIGLPTPANAIFWLGLVNALPNWFDNEINPWIILGVAIVSSLLLVMPIPMFSLKFKNFTWRDNKLRFIFILGVIVLVAIFLLDSLSIIIMWYIALSFVNNIVVRK